MFEKKRQSISTSADDDKILVAHLELRRERSCFVPQLYLEIYCEIKMHVSMGKLKVGIAAFVNGGEPFVIMVGKGKHQLSSPLGWGCWYGEPSVLAKSHRSVLAKSYPFWRRKLRLKSGYFRYK